MDNKTLSIVSYITLIGWLISFFSGKDNADKLLKYHLRQSFGLFLFTVVLGIALSVVITVTHLTVLGILDLAPLILIVIGIINASNGVEKPLPLIGKMFEDKFSFIG